jgi:hypothetical protein
MLSNKGMLAVLVAVVALPAAAQGNSPPPKPWELDNGRSFQVPADHVVPLVIRVDDSAAEARLVVPRRFLAALGKTQTASAAGADGFLRENRVGTVVAGLCLSLAAVCAGLRLARSRAALSGRTLAAGAGAILVVAGATLAWAGTPVEPQPRPPAPTVVVEVVEQGEAVQFIASRAVLARFRAPADASRVAVPPGK